MWAAKWVALKVVKRANLRVVSKVVWWVDEKAVLKVDWRAAKDEKRAAWKAVQMVVRKAETMVDWKAALTAVLRAA